MKKISTLLILVLQLTIATGQTPGNKSTMDSIKNWDRKYYTKAQDSPFIFYAIHGDFSADFHISNSKYRTLGLPDGFRLIKYGPGKYPETVKSFLEGYLWEDLKKTNKGLSDQIMTSGECFILSGELPDTSNLNYLRDIVGIITYLLDNGGVSVYDPQAFTFFGKSAWAERIFNPNGSVPRNHVMILYSEENGLKWYHTRGLRKFGRPDLSIHNVPKQYEEAVTDLFNRFIEYVAFGGIIEEGQKIKMQSLPAGMWCENKGDFDDPDFNNKHVEINWK
jgi:hypothetical protein